MRVMLAEDSAVVREGLARLLADAGHEVVAQVSSSEALLDAVERALTDAADADRRVLAVLAYLGAARPVLSPPSVARAPGWRLRRGE